MKTIIVKYHSSCKKCGEDLLVGSEARYERITGIFHPKCEPIEREDIREFRAARLERKAARLDNKVARLRSEASIKCADFDRMREDIAFLTQPGRLPWRDRIIKRYDKGIELAVEAHETAKRATHIRQAPRVKGDAEIKRQAKRDVVLTWLKVGMKVNTGIYGVGIIAKINKKTATIKDTGASGTWTTNVDLSFLSAIHLDTGANLSQAS